jgi:glycosyltransferase involved in cell wall biosynthesis
VVSPSVDQIKALVDERPAESVHIFKERHQVPIVRRAFEYAAGRGVTIGWILEKRPTLREAAVRSSDKQRMERLRSTIAATVVTSFARQLRYFISARRDSPRVDFMLLAGFGGKSGMANFMAHSGFPREKLWPYGHFPAVERVDRTDGDSVPGPFRILLLGQCIRRKAGDVLIGAMKHVSAGEWVLDVIGDGPQREDWIKLSKTLGLSERVRFTRTLSHKEALLKIGESDVYVLPSRFDGWGASVGESLTLGTPVVCSASCGSMDLLGESWRGDVFRSEDERELADLLRARISLGRPSVQDRAKISAWAADCISPQSAARYVAQVAQFVRHEGPKPAAPWLRS